MANCVKCILPKKIVKSATVLQGFSQRRPSTPELSPVVMTIAKEFKTNGGSSLRDGNRPSQAERHLAAIAVTVDEIQSLLRSTL